MADEKDSEDIILVVCAQAVEALGFEKVLKRKKSPSPKKVIKQVVILKDLKLLLFGNRSEVLRLVQA